MKTLFIFKLVTSLAMVTLFTACGHFKTSLPAEIATSKTYFTPKNYQQHRAQQQRFKTSDGDYAFTDDGSGKETIVMLHGVPTNSWMYRKVIPSLQKTNRVISIDLLGFGSSSKPEKANYSARNQAKNVIALLDKIKAQNITLMMHDMGGLVAWEMLRQRSSKIKNFIVLNTIVTEKGFNHPKMKPSAMTKAITTAYSSNLSSSAILKMTFMHMGLTGPKRLSSNACEGYVAPLKEGSNHALYAFFTSLNPTLYAQLRSYEPALRRFKGNTLVLWGAKDKNLTTEQIPYLQKALHIPAKNIHIYPNAGHLLTEEKPEAVISEINALLNE